MITIYVYVLDTLADWELGFTTAELHSGRYFKKDAPSLTLKTVSVTKDPITTMGGMKVIPDCTIDEILLVKDSVLLLPGADTWSEPKHAAILETADKLLSLGATVCGICGATVALANAGILDNRKHTSNGPGFLDMFCPDYKGRDLYLDKPAVRDNNLITAGCSGSLQFAKEIIEYLDVFKPETLEAWYTFFSSGKAENFYALMATLENR